VVTHEIGHVLGLQHSNVKGSLMFPYDINDSWNFPPLDGETAEVLRDLYGWAFHNFSDGRTSADPPSLARTTEPAGFGSGTWRRARSLLHMVWTGPEGVPGLSYSQSGNHGRTWTTKRQLTWPPNGTPVHGTALASYSTGADPAQNEFLLAWAGESEQLWYATSLGDGVNVPAVRLIGHSSDPSRGTRGRCGRPPRLEVQRRPAGLVGHLPRGTWSTAIAIPHLITEHAPALGISDGRVFIVVRNPNNSLLVECELLPDGRWTQPRAVTTFDFSGGPGNEAAPEGSPAYTTTSTHEPSATTPRSGEMLLAFRRSNGRLATLRRGRFGGGSVPVWKYFSDKAPAVAAVDDDVVVVGIGPDQRLYYVFREARLGLAERYDEPGSMQQVADLIRHL
jgi:matrixin